MAWSAAARAAAAAARRKGQGSKYGLNTPGAFSRKETAMYLKRHRKSISVASAGNVGTRNELARLRVKQASKTASQLWKARNGPVSTSGQNASMNYAINARRRKGGY